MGSSVKMSRQGEGAFGGRAGATVLAVAGSIRSARTLAIGRVRVAVPRETGGTATTTDGLALTKGSAELLLDDGAATGPTAALDGAGSKGRALLVAGVPVRAVASGTPVERTRAE